MADDVTMLPEELFGWDDLPADTSVARPRDRAHVVRLAQLCVLAVAVALVLVGAAAVLELVTGLLDDLALGSTPR